MGRGWIRSWLQSSQNRRRRCLVKIDRCSKVGGRPDPRRAGFQGLTGIEQGGGQSKTAPVTGTRPNLQRETLRTNFISSPHCAVSLPPREQLITQAVCETVCS